MGKDLRLLGAPNNANGAAQPPAKPAEPGQARDHPEARRDQPEGAEEPGPSRPLSGNPGSAPERKKQRIKGLRSHDTKSDNEIHVYKNVTSVISHRPIQRNCSYPGCDQSPMAFLAQDAKKPRGRRSFLPLPFI